MRKLINASDVRGDLCERRQQVYCSERGRKLDDPLLLLLSLWTVFFKSAIYKKKIHSYVSLLLLKMCRKWLQGHVNSQVREVQLDRHGCSLQSGLRSDRES